MLNVVFLPELLSLSHLPSQLSVWNGFDISQDPSTGLMTTMLGPRRTARPSERDLLGENARPVSGSKMSSSMSSITRFRSWSKPLRVPMTSLPAVNLTRTRLSTYLDKSRIGSLFGFSPSLVDVPARDVLLVDAPLPLPRPL